MIKEVGIRKWIWDKWLARIVFLVKWMLIASVIGVVLGIISGTFAVSIEEVTEFRQTHDWMVYLLPAAGILIVALYKFDPERSGTNRILEGIHSGKSVPLRMAPLIIISTVITHAFGASAGREGAALQLGGSVGDAAGKWMKMDECDRKILIMCGMSAAFSALFGTPLTAAVFSMEVVSVGIMQYAALVPCSVAAIVGRQTAKALGAEGESFLIPKVTPFNLKYAILVIILAIICALISIIFCKALHLSEKWFKTYIKNEWLRPVAGAVMIILLVKVLNTTDYLGAGMDIVDEAIEGEVVSLAFFWKIIFTAIALGSGFKGGEIVPSLFIGATFGCLFGQIVGMEPSLCAACGMSAVFCGVTNCPMTTLFLSFELFGFSCMPFFLLAVGVGYMESGYSGVYHSQKILYSKTQLRYINAKTKE